MLLKPRYNLKVQTDRLGICGTNAISYIIRCHEMFLLQLQNLIEREKIKKGESLLMGCKVSDVNADPFPEPKWPQVTPVGDH